MNVTNANTRNVRNVIPISRIVTTVIKDIFLEIKNVSKSVNTENMTSKFLKENTNVENVKIKNATNITERIIVPNVNNDINLIKENVLNVKKEKLLDLTKNVINVKKNTVINVIDSQEKFVTIVIKVTT